MKRLLLAGVAAAALVSPLPARTQTAATRLVFAAVDALEIKASVFSITGVVDGESAARTVNIYFYSGSSAYPDEIANCQRMAILAMTRPGQFRFEIQDDAYATACKLARSTP